ncbi:hypothetical protein ASG32_10645 [Methylobacterium sp. Leaf361]|nr:hypothetical protein ASG32_10645 [Methylobacterium sp. Leaf361]
MSGTTWSAAMISTTACGSLAAACSAATATAAAESRPCGSSRMSAERPSWSRCSATMKRASAEAMTVGVAKTVASDTRASVAWKVERSASTRRANCLGMLSREAGHSRVPVPPHRIIGWIWIEGRDMVTSPEKARRCWRGRARPARVRWTLGRRFQDLPLPSGRDRNNLRALSARRRAGSVHRDGYISGLP